MKKKQISILIILYLVVMVYGTSNAQAISYEGNSISGGLESYVEWFSNYSGVLIVTSTFPNNTGIEFADITILGVCVDESKVFRLRVHDSDESQFINPEKELGVGVNERRIAVQPHMDTDFLVWTVQATSEDGLIIYAEIILIYEYDPDSIYDPVVPEEELYPGWEEEKKKLVIRSFIWVTQSLVGTVIAIFVAVKLANRIWGAG